MKAPLWCRCSYWLVVHLFIELQDLLGVGSVRENTLKFGGAREDSLGVEFVWRVGLSKAFEDQKMHLALRG